MFFSEEKTPPARSPGPGRRQPPTSLVAGGSCLCWKASQLMALLKNDWQELKQISTHLLASAEAGAAAAQLMYASLLPSPPRVFPAFSGAFTQSRTVSKSINKRQKCLFLIQPGGVKTRFCWFLQKVQHSRRCQRKLIL